MDKVLEHLMFEHRERKKRKLRKARIEDLMVGLSREPHQALSLRAKDAWWYEKKNSIEIYFQMTNGRDTVSCRIPIYELRDWIRRVDKR